MTSESPSPSAPTVAPVSTTSSSAESPDVRKGPLKRLAYWIGPANFAIPVIWGAVPGMLMAIQVGDLDPDNKVTNLATITAIGAIFAMFAQPLAGQLSDRTRSKLGRRAPWIIGGTAAGSIALVLMGYQRSIVAITICWSIVQVSYNFANGPLGAVMPERVPKEQRGAFSTRMGIGSTLGSLSGSFVGAQFRNMIPMGYWVMALTAIIVLTVFCVRNPDKSSRGMKVDPFSFSTFIKGFWVNPFKFPDFFWVFVGSTLLGLGYNMITSFMLYILADYVNGGMGLDQAAILRPKLSLASIPIFLISSALAGPISDKIGKRRIFVFLSTVIIAMAVTVPLMWPTVEGMYVYSILSSFGFGFLQPVNQVVIMNALPSEAEYGKDMGIMNISVALPQSVAPALSGVVVGLFGFAGVFPISIILCLFSSVCVWHIKSSE